MTQHQPPTQSPAQPQTQDKQQLRIFGLALAGAILFWLLLITWLNDKDLLWAWPVWLIIILLVDLALFKPIWLNGTHRVWMKLVGWLNLAITNLLLGTIFWLVITPVGLLRQLFGNDALKNKPRLPDSYRIKSEPLSGEDMEHPY